MRLHEYQKAALRTCPKDNMLLHGVLGIAGEVGEIITSYSKTDIIEECGDILWYMAIVCEDSGFTMEDLEFTEGEEEELIDIVMVATSNLVDHVKRHLFYKTEINKDLLQVELSMLVSRVSELLNEWGSTLEECMELNIKKLEERYPNKFSTEKAVNRNVYREKKAVEE